MILKNTSILVLNFSEIWNRGVTKIKDLNNFDKCMTIFWLIGPFIYLIERSPADIWLTSLGLCFIYRCIRNKHWYWLNQLWVKSILIFWIVAIFSSIISPEPEFSTSRAIVWIRFPLYAIAAQVWLAREKEIRYLMLLSLLVGSLIMMCFISYEFFYPFNIADFSPKGRLTGPYGDHVPGGYFAKVCLPIFCICVSLINSKNKVLSLVCTLFVLLFFAHTIMTGERIHVLILICSAFLALLFWKPNIKKIVILFSLILSIFCIYFFSFSQQLTHRFSQSFVKSLPLNTSYDNPYWGAWRSGLQQGLETPIIGIGANGTRKTCKDLPFTNKLPGKNYCGNHPHNFYIQFFAETGLIGLFFGIGMFFFIIKTCWEARNIKEPEIFAYIAFIIPLAIFFPFQNHGNFFGQWGNLFIWIAIGLAISNNQKWYNHKLEKII
jgi:O-antigen ligase